MTVVATSVLELEENSSFRYPACLDLNIVLNPSRICKGLESRIHVEPLLHGLTHVV